MNSKLSRLGFLGLDIGGTWIKATFVEDISFENLENVSYKKFPIKKIKSPLSKHASHSDLIETIKELITYFKLELCDIKGIGISTAGIVDYSGKKVLRAAEHLNILKSSVWKDELEKYFDCYSVLINDSDAACIGAAELGLISGNKTVGIMPIGTGLGFSVWRNGRRWRPGKTPNLLGSIRTPDGFFDSIASASLLASIDSSHNLINVLTKDSHKEKQTEYFQNLVNIINTAAIIYNLDEVMICGGLADATTSCGYPLEEKLNTLLSRQQVELDKTIKATVLKEGNKLQLIGAVSLAKSEFIAKSKQLSRSYKAIETENPYQKEAQLQDLPTSELIQLLWSAEQEAGKWLEKSLPYLEEVIDEIFVRVNKGGRIIYVGCGTSGRIASMDALEIPCTYGFPEDRILCLIAGGIADASIEIESKFEEDASAVPELLLLNIKPDDVVIGISASGTAYYVQSALAVAKERGAYSVMIQSEMPQTKLPFCNITIPLNSGCEVVAGSTRMKAGTATKKILNFITTSVMIKMGKVEGSYMTDVACINNKLIERAQEILKILFQIDGREALEKLQDANMQLNEVIMNIKRYN